MPSTGSNRVFGSFGGSHTMMLRQYTHSKLQNTLHIPVTWQNFIIITWKFCSNSRPKTRLSLEWNSIHKHYIVHKVSLSVQEITSQSMRYRHCFASIQHMMQAQTLHPNSNNYNDRISPLKLLDKISVLSQPAYVYIGVFLSTVTLA